jgi:hypothetical protein
MCLEELGAAAEIIHTISDNFSHVIFNLFSAVI